MRRYRLTHAEHDAGTHTNNPAVNVHVITLLVYTRRTRLDTAALVGTHFARMAIRGLGSCAACAWREISIRAW